MQLMYTMELPQTPTHLLTLLQKTGKIILFHQIHNVGIGAEADLQNKKQSEE